MVNMEAHAKAMGTEVISDIITELDLQNRPFTAKGDSGTTYTADAIILATGARAKWLGLPSEDKFKGFGVSACATCDGFFYREKPIVVIGGGNTAVEEALFLTNFGSKVTLVHRRDELRAEKILIDRLMKHPKVEVKWDSVLKEVIGTDMPMGVTGVTIENVKTGAISEIVADGVFIAIGHAPGLGTGQGPARAAPRRLREGGAGLDPHLDPRRLRRRRPHRPRLPPGGDLGRHGLHGRARRRTLAVGAGRRDQRPGAGDVGEIGQAGSFPAAAPAGPAPRLL